MASSTTRPTESTMASIVSTLMEKPSRYMMKNAPMSDTGITIQGTSVTRQSRRKRKIMMITSTNASTTVFFTSLIEARMKRVLSKPYLYSTSSGRSFFIISIRSYTASAMLIWLAPGCGTTTTPTMGTPFIFM